MSMSDPREYQEYLEQQKMSISNKQCTKKEILTAEIDNIIRSKINLRSTGNNCGYCKYYDKENGICSALERIIINVTDNMVCDLYEDVVIYMKTNETNS